MREIRRHFVEMLLLLFAQAQGKNVCFIITHKAYLMFNKCEGYSVRKSLYQKRGNR